MSDDARRLKAATSAVKEILHHYDVGGNIVLVSPTGFESFLKIDPTWSCAKLIENGVKIDAKKSSFKTQDERTEALERTVYLLLKISQQADEARHFGSLIREHLKSMVAS